MNLIKRGNLGSAGTPLKSGGGKRENVMSQIKLIEKQSNEKVSSNELQDSPEEYIDVDEEEMHLANDYGDEEDEEDPQSPAKKGGPKIEIDRRTLFSSDMDRDT